MKDADKAEDWCKALAHVSGRDLCWHLEGVLKGDGEGVLKEVLRRLEIKSVIDLIRRAA